MADDANYARKPAWWVLDAALGAASARASTPGISACVPKAAVILC